MNDITINTKVNGADINKLVQRLKKEDTRNLQTFKRFQWMFLVLVILYSFIFIFNPFEELEWIYRLTGICFVSAFIIFGLIFRKYYREYKSIDYTLPVIEMLKKAADRYSLQYKKLWITIFPVLLIDAGVTISFFQRLSNYAPWERIGLVQLLYIPTMIISALIGIWIWYKRQKPLRDGALKLLEELEN